MNLRELKYGNYVHDRHGNLQVVTGVTFVNYEMKNSSQPPEGVKNMELKPIIITKEWLKKLGFDEMQVKRGYWYRSLTIDGKMSLDSDDFIFHLKSGYVQMDFMDIISSIGIPLIYVHQLQNLYFALTGEELTRVK